MTANTQPAHDTPSTELTELAGHERLATLPEPQLFVLRSKPLTEAQRSIVEQEIERRVAMRTHPPIAPAAPNTPSFLLLADICLILNGCVVPLTRGDVIADYRLGHLQSAGAELAQIATVWRTTSEVGQQQVQLELVDGRGAIPPAGAGYDLLLLPPGSRPDGWCARWIQPPEKQFDEILRRR